jgi:hypothetical protein
MRFHYSIWAQKWTQEKISTKRIGGCGTKKTGLSVLRRCMPATSGHASEKGDFFVHSHWPKEAHRADEGGMVSETTSVSETASVSETLTTTVFPGAHVSETLTASAFPSRQP